MSNISRKILSIELYEYISSFVCLESTQTVVLSTSNVFNVNQIDSNSTSFVNLGRINNIRYINKFFIEVNQKMDIGDSYICCSETIVSRFNRQRVHKIPVVRNVFNVTEFVFLRIAPKVWGIRKIYFFITRGRRRLLSKAECLGRLVSCGFEIQETKTIDGILYIITKKIGPPINRPNVSYGPLFKMNRLGKHNKIIGVYKFRTMHPYSEFLQDYVLKLNGYAESGKPKDDFRLTPWGKWMRRFWIDETPQLINVIKGELKLVGVRPIGERYFQDIPKDLQTLRMKHKPGCIPPYVALDRKSSVDGVLEAERKYLEMKEKKPYTTDITLFFKALYHIIIKRRRSA